MKTNVIKTIFFCICLLIPAIISANDAKPSPFKVYSTSIIKRNNGNPSQIGIIEISDHTIQSLDVLIEFPDHTQDYHFTDLNKSNFVVRFEFPVLKEEINVPIKIRQENKILLNTTIRLYPPKKWKIYDIEVSHQDLGYADYYQFIRRDVREMGIEMAMDFARKTDSWPKESQFHWTIETSEQMIQYLSRQPQSVLNELKMRIEKGQIVLGGIHNSVSTEFMGRESLARLFYTPNRHVCDWLGIKPSKTALDDDVVGFSRALPLYSKEADIPYFFFGRNSCTKAFDKAEDDAAFYWQPTDKDKKMTLFKIWSYYSPDRFTKYDVSEVAHLCEEYEQHKNYPYECILSEDSFDFGLPQFENVQGIKKWNETYSNPTLISGTFDMYFDDLSSQQTKESFKVYDKDAPNAWADQEIADTKYNSKARILNYKIPATEKWATITSSITTEAYPWSDIYQAYYGLLSWNEHTNGAYSEGPIFTPPSLKDKTAANATYYELEQVMHRDLLRESEKFTDNAKQLTVSHLKDQIATKSSNTLVLTNPLFRDRSEYVQVTIPKGMHLQRLTDNCTNQDLNYQLMDNGKILFYAEKVPSMGYKAYSIRLKKGEAKISSKKITSPTIENDCYKLAFDQTTGAIKSIYDKKLKRELVDTQSRFKLNEYYYERFESGNYQEGTTKYSPTKAHFELISGPIAQSVISTVIAEGCKEITQKVTIYSKSNHIDFDLTLDKENSGRTLENYRDYSTKGKEALFYCLPFDIPNFTINHDLASGVMEPIEDQFKGSATDYYVIQNFSDMSNANWGITLATREPNILEYGSPRPAFWGTVSDSETIMKKAEKSHFYLYLADNMFLTNLRQTQKGVFNFHYSIRSHQANWEKSKAYIFGQQVSNPMDAFYIKGQQQGPLPDDKLSFVKTNSDHIICTTLKPAESNGEGLIMRFVELAGRDTIVTVDANFITKIAHANLTNLVEVDRDYPLKLTGDNQFQFYISANGLRTIRLIPKKETLPTIKNLRATALSDREVELNWDIDRHSKAKVTYYEVYRSEQENFIPSLKTYVANVSETTFLDRPVLNFRGWQSNQIRPQTTYYYKILPIGKNNNKGIASHESMTQTKNSRLSDTKPNKVLGFKTTLISTITDHNYIGMYFYTNIEEDVNTYNIYRSTQKGFIPQASTLLFSLDATQKIEHITPHGFGKAIRPLKAYNRQLYVDEDISPFTTYYYRVAAVDAAGQIGDFSDESSTTSSIENIQIESKTITSGETQITIINRKAKEWEIRYTLDGQLPTRNSPLYSAPILTRDDCVFQASLYLPGYTEGLGKIKQEVKTTKDYKVTYHTTYHKDWSGIGNKTLIDGYKGGPFISKRWQGFQGKDLDITIDMKKEKTISSVTVGCLQYYGSWVYLPNYIEISTSKDGIHFNKVGRAESVKEWQRLIAKTSDISVTFAKTKTRYIRVFAKNIDKNPSWHTFAGQTGTWLFIDEVLID